MVAKYAEAAQERNAALQQFYRQSVVRPPTSYPSSTVGKQQRRRANQRVGVFEDKDYLADQFADYNKTVAAAEQAARESQEAGEVAEAYVGTTILLAVALFFAGVTSSFKSRLARILLLIAATGAVAVAASRIADLPII